MADPRTGRFEYTTRGSAAVAPSRRPQQSPREDELRTPRHQTHRKHGRRMAIAPLAVAGTAVAMLMLMLVLFGYVRVYESGQAVSDMQERVEVLHAENMKLQNRYDTAIDLQKVEERARELGMQQPSAKQIVTLQIAVEDTTVVTQKAASNPLAAAWEAVTETARSFWAYLHG